MALLSLAATQAIAGGVEGRVRLDIDGARLSDLGPIVAFLSSGMAVGTPPEPAVIRQVNAQFVPRFLVVSAGQEISMPNMDMIFHNVFSFSRPNDFDLGLYPKGDTRSVKMKEPGVVHFYCSIHASMSGVVLVSPTPFHASVDAKGRFSIEDVPAGEYEITIWNERLPQVTRKLSVTEMGIVDVDLALGAPSF